MPDWRDALLVDLQSGWEPGPLSTPQPWPGYLPRMAVRVRRGQLAGHEAVVAAWDFSAYGGSFGEADATALVAAVDVAVTSRLPLVTWLRSGGTRLQEGMAALVGIPRARLALHRLADAALSHVAVCDAPTTGGVWIAIGSGADLRCGIAGATVGFAGPRVVEAVTGAPPPAGSHTAESAYAAGLLDAVLTPAEVGDWLAAALHALRPGGPATSGPGGMAGGATPRPPVRWAQDVPARSGAEQVRAARARRMAGTALIDALLVGAVDLRARGGDTTVRAALGRLGRTDGPGTVIVALAAGLRTAPTPSGYGLLARAAGLADRLGLPLVTLVDTPGAASDAAAEADGVAPAIAQAIDEVLSCRSPTLAFVHGEGGSGGALAATVCDRVLVGWSAYFAALGPEGAAVALRTDPDTAADQMGVTPPDLLGLGVADELAPDPERMDPDEFADLLGERLRRLREQPSAGRLERRARRWAGPAPGRARPASAQSFSTGA